MSMKSPYLLHVSGLYYLWCLNYGKKYLAWTSCAFITSVCIFSEVRRESSKRRIRAEKSDFWKSISKAAAQGDLNQFYPPCIVNAGSDVLDG